MVMILILVIILGLVVGSFLNAVIYRLRAGISFLKGRSYCPKCKHDLNVWDLIPLFSYVFLKGKCRYCQKKISWQYPLVELGTVLAFVFLFINYDLGIEFFVYVIFSCFLMIIFVYDLRYYLILDKVAIPAFVVAVLLSLFVLEISIVQIALGVLVGGGFFLIQFVISKGKWIGGGDIRLGALMGAMLGLNQLLLALFIAYFFGAIIGVFLMIFGKKKWKSQVPLGTFLTAATYVTIIYGERIIDWYLNSFLL